MHAANELNVQGTPREHREISRVRRSSQRTGRQAASTPRLRGRMPEQSVEPEPVAGTFDIWGMVDALAARTRRVVLMGLFLAVLALLAGASIWKPVYTAKAMLLRNGNPVRGDGFK